MVSFKWKSSTFLVVLDGRTTRRGLKRRDGGRTLLHLVRSTVFRDSNYEMSLRNRLKSRGSVKFQELGATSQYYTLRNDKTRVQ